MNNGLSLTFFSNFLNHHQTPFCEAMVRLLGNGFRFVATERISQDRLDMGYQDLSHATSYAVNAYERREEALRLGLESDVVILGDAPDAFIADRLKANKLTFRYSERYFKEGRWHILDPRVAYCRYRQDFRYRNRKLYMLCSGAYTGPDCRFIHSYPNKTFKWGYFPQIHAYESIDRLIEQKKPASILWTGRFLDLKHPGDALPVARQLKQEGIPFHLTMIGDGEEKEGCLRYIAENGLSDCVEMLGFMPPKKVREQMEKSDLFLFTSDRNEGWGAVLNESMNSGCAVVCCCEIGSVPYVVQHGVNGLIYDRHGDNTLYANVKRLLEDAGLKNRLQHSAYETVVNVWNADAAAERLLTLIDCLQSGRETPYPDGPCSRD